MGFIGQFNLTVLCSVFLVGCGGGGGESPVITPPAVTTTTTTTTTPLPSTPSFDVEFSSIPDFTIENAIAELDLPNCTLSNIQQVMFLDLNNDDRKDILAFVLCGDLNHPNTSPDVVHDESTPNTMIALLSQRDGSYEVNNIDVFGKNHVQLGGEMGGIIGNITALEDTSAGIGLPHITYIISRDDFRRTRSDDFSNHFSYQGVLTPDFNNQYNMNTLGETPIWAQGQAVLPNQSYGWDLLYGYWEPTFQQEDVYAYRNNGQKWDNVSEEYSNNDATKELSQWNYLTTVDTENHAPFGEIKSSTANYTFGGGGHGFGVYDITAGQVTKIDEFDHCKEIGCIDWKGSEGVDTWCMRKEIVTLNGNYYFGGMAWDHFELWWPTPDSEPLVLAWAAVTTLPEGEVFDANKEYGCDTEFVGGTVVTAFSFVDGNIVLADTPFENALWAGGGTHKQTVDLNNDGYMDLWVSGGTGYGYEPDVYINNKEGMLIKEAHNQLPKLSEKEVCDESTGYCLKYKSTGLLVDLNDDGITDMVQFHEGSVTPNLYDFVFEQGSDGTVFENQSGLISVWYGE